MHIHLLIQMLALHFEHHKQCRTYQNIYQLYLRVWIQQLGNVIGKHSSKRQTYSYHFKPTIVVCEGRASGKGNRRRTKEQGAERNSQGLGCTGSAWEYKETLRFKATELERFARINTGATGDQALRSLEGAGAEVLTITPDIYLLAL